jgi:1-acyl-sn-glycerol-3-phosphate acyltransferase
MLGCPIVDPRRDAKGSVEVVREAARTLRHGLLIFPEGHRSRDGEIRPFRVAGLTAILSTRSLPVYLIVNEGVWTSRRLVDFALNIHRMRGEAEVLGPFESPRDEAGIPEFIEAMRGKLVAGLQSMRERRSDDDA